MFVIAIILKITTANMIILIMTSATSNIINSIIGPCDIVVDVVYFGLVLVRFSDDILFEPRELAPLFRTLAGWIHCP